MGGGDEMKNESIYYRGNKNLKAENVDLEYTEEQIEEIIKCANDYEYFIYKYVMIKTKKGLEKPEIRPYQQRILKAIHENKRLLISAGRQSGKNAVISMYYTWYICFNSYKTVGIVGNKEKVAKLTLANIKNIFVNIPLFLKPGVVQWGMTDIKLDNGCIVVVSACSADALTGYTLNALLVDEVAKIPKNKAHDFFDSVFPTVEADENAKVICFSTPKGMNIWYKMWKEAVAGLSGYATVSVAWNEPPGRDDEWRKKKIAEKGLQYFAQEFSCEFAGSSSTLIDGNKLKSLVIRPILFEEYEGRLKIYEKPIKHHKYVLNSDVGEGVGRDYSTIQIIDVSEEIYKQVAVYKDNTTKPFSFHLPIAKLGTLYNMALVIIERNSCGAEVLNNLHFESEYENVFYEDEFGLRTTKKTKSIGCSNLSFLIENDKLDIGDYETINELSTFVASGTSFKAQDYDDHDDLVMPLVLFAYLILNKQLAEQWLDINYVEKINKDKEEDINDNLLPSLFMDDEDYDD